MHYEVLAPTYSVQRRWLTAHAEPGAGGGPKEPKSEPDVLAVAQRMADELTERTKVFTDFALQEGSPADGPSSSEH
ncbi:hypothetical protein [Occultella kanbiaonis]|uniref:hypothetical protein n=1 Tax=Occultella kanbiaonis TaxID=2675754 RepID=UPI0012B77404|nr:hypothetical protein [Occultella kanbiaonis]